MPFSVNDAVFVRRLGRHGTVAQLMGSGRYRIAVGSIQIVCREADLEPPKVQRSARQPAAAATQRSAMQSVPPLDLHGLRVAEAVAALDEALNRAVLAGADRLEVIHGIGTGRVRSAVLRRLKELSVVVATRADPANAGTTWVYF